MRFTVIEQGVNRWRASFQHTVQTMPTRVGAGIVVVLQQDN
jgi:hypothetical protein